MRKKIATFLLFLFMFQVGVSSYGQAAEPPYFAAISDVHEGMVSRPIIFSPKSPV